MKKTIIAVIGVIAILLVAWAGFARKADAPSNVVDDPTRDWKRYSNTDLGFVAKIPEGFAVNESFFYTVSPGREIPGVKFSIPGAMATGTNLSNDTGVSVEKLARANCTPSDFLQTPSRTTMTNFGALIYASATTTDAAAGNRYEETVFVRKVGEPCFAIRFFVHYGNIANYEPGAVQEFDKKALIETFEQIATTVDFK